MRGALASPQVDNPLLVRLCNDLRESMEPKVTVQSPRSSLPSRTLLLAYPTIQFPINTFGLVYEEASVPSTLANKCADFSSVRALLSEKFPFPILSFRSAPVFFAEPHFC